MAGDEDLLDRVGRLADLELAFLLCLVNREHCIVTTQAGSLDDLVQELQLIAARTFGLSPLTISCTPHTTLDDLASSIVHSSAAAAPAASAATSPALLPLQRADDFSGRARSPSPLRARLLRHGSHPHAVSPSAESYFAFSSPPLPSGPSAAAHLAGVAVGGGGGGGTGGAGAGSAGTIANVVLARDLDRAPRAVQIQVLELLRTRRIFTRTSVQTAPRPFLFIAVLRDDPDTHAHTHAHAHAHAHAHTNSSFPAAIHDRRHSHSRARSAGPAASAAGPVAPPPVAGTMTALTPHLNDYFFIAHRHDAKADGFPNSSDEWRREQQGGPDSETASTESVLRKSLLGDLTIPVPPPTAAAADTLIFSEDDISHLANLSREVQVDVEVVRYQMNIASFLRMHRAVAGGISPAATKHLGRLMRSLAPLNRIDYVTPALVALAARKVYMHRIRIVAAEKERSMQWNSSLGAIREMLEGVGSEEVIEDVLGMVAAPS